MINIIIIIITGLSAFVILEYIIPKITIIIQIDKRYIKLLGSMLISFYVYNKLII
jgi:hypothetical protein